MTNLERPFLARIGLIKRSTIWRPTLWAWLWLALLAGAAGIGGFRWIYPFLAVTDRVNAKVLVVEGWLPDITPIDAVVREFNEGHYELMIVTGGPTPKRELLGEFGTYAELTKAIMEKRGIDPNAIVAVPSLGVKRDRTYTSALALGQWMQAHRPSILAFNLVTLGAHGRRSRLLFQKAMGGGVRVGVISIGEQRFEAGQWWTSSSGMREVLGEAIAYAYARLGFMPPGRPT